MLLTESNNKHNSKTNKYLLSENVFISLYKPKNNIMMKYHPNHYFDKIFIINLNTSPERWNHVTKNLLDFGITNFEKQPGIYLPRKDALDILPPQYYINLEAYGGKFKFENNYILNCVGTNLAHYNIVEKAIQRNYKRILVLEDDIFLDKKFLEIFTKGAMTLDSYNNNWHLLYLGYKHSRPQFSGHMVSEQLMIPKQFIRGAYGYALNFPAFNIITKMKLYGGMEIDAFFEFVMCKYGKVFCFNKPIINHRDNMISTITNHKWKTRKF